VLSVAWFGANATAVPNYFRVCPESFPIAAAVQSCLVVRLLNPRRAISTAVKFRRLLKLLAVVPAAGWPLLLPAQLLPPPDLLLTEPRPALLILGPLDVHVRASSAFFYDDNINVHGEGPVLDGIQTGGTRRPLGDDFITTIGPGIILNKAATLEDSRTAFSLDYSPTFVFFAKNDEENSIDHTVRAEGGYALTKLTLGVVQEYVSTAGSVIDVGDRVSQVNYRTTANARYELTGKTFLQTDGAYRITDYEALTDSTEWTVSATVNYQLSPKVTLGLGGSVGQLFVTEESQFQYVAGTNTNTVVRTGTQTQTHFGPTFRASYRTTEKTDVSISVGGDWRRYPGGQSSFDPVFSITATYRPFETTAFSFEAHRQEQNSAVLNGQNFISTGFSLAMRQKLWDRLTGHFTFSFNNSEYKSTQRNVRATRSDDYFLLRYGLDAIIRQSWTVGIFHQYREDTSSDESFSFENNQAGIQVSWLY